MTRDEAVSVEDLFWSHIDAGGGQECWGWNGGRRSSSQGYGGFYVPIATADGSALAPYRGRTVRANRIVLELFLGRPLAPGMYACHRCDNASCVNPTHLYEGTPADNRRDLAAVERATRKTCRLGHPLHQQTARRRCLVCAGINAKRHRVSAPSGLGHPPGPALSGGPAIPVTRPPLF